MKTQLETIEEGKIKLILEFEKDASSKAYSYVIKNISKDVKVPGFMPGKVPRSIIEERVGKNSIQIQAVEKLIADHLPKAISEEKLDLISQPVLENSNFDFENTLNVSLILETRPEVTLGEYKDVKVEIPKSELKDVTIDSLLEDLTKQISPWEDAPEGAVVEEGNIITMDFEGKFVDGSEMPDHKGTDIRVKAEKDNFAPNVMEQLSGLKVGETKDVNSAFPEDYPDKDFAGKEATFTVTVKKIEKQNLIPVGEELAEKAGQKDMEALKMSLQFQIEKSKENVERSRKQAVVLNEVLNNSKVSIPEWLVEREAKAQFEREKLMHQQQHHHDGSDCGHDFPSEPTDELKEIAKNKLKFNLVLADIARKENIQLTNKELDAYIQYWKQMRQMSGQGSADEQIPQQIINQMAEELLFEKITDWIINKADVTLIDETEENLKQLETVQNSLTSFLASSR